MSRNALFGVGVGVSLFGLYSLAEKSKRFGVFSIQGRRQYQEDRYIADTEMDLYGVFDGHGGENASECSKKEFAKNFKEALKANNNELNNSVWIDTFRMTEEKYRNWNHALLDNPKKESKWEEGREGSTACVTKITAKQISVANAGDSRCVVCSETKAIPMSRDHKPLDPDEHARLKKHGYYVHRTRIYKDVDGKRKGGLNLSRAIGDLFYEEGVTCTPEIRYKRLESEDQYVVIGSDGVWDVLSNEEVCAIVRSSTDLELSRIASAIVTSAYSAGSGDNITAVVIDLNEFKEKKMST